MPNLLQKSIYNLSSAAPLCLLFEVAWCTQYHTKTIPIICIIVFGVLVAAFEISFRYGKKNLLQFQSM